MTDDNPIANIKVNYLFDGENREEITNGLAGVDSLEWLVPDTKSLYCYAEVIVTDIAGNDGYGYDQDPFIIADYTPLYHAAFMNPDYLGGHNLGYLDIRQQFGADGGVFLPDTVHPQISSDPGYPSGLRPRRSRWAVHIVDHHRPARRRKVSKP